MPLAAPLRSWIDCEQTVNERIINERLHSPIDRRGNTVPPRFWPEARAVWPLDFVSLPVSEVREYGDARALLRRTFRLSIPRDRAVMFVHPQARPLYRRRIARHGLARSGIDITPTASYRSVLAWKAGRPPAVLKLSLDATIAKVHRRLPERQIARGLFVSRVLDTIPTAARNAVGLDWFPERAGVALARERHGWLFRQLPAALRNAAAETRLVPAFSLISRRDDRPPLLVDLIRRAGERPELFVARNVLVPYVNALAYLLLEEGVACEGHMQNVLYEVSATGAETGGLTGRIVLRDLGDASVNVALRVARGKPLPVAPSGFFPRAAGFPFVSNAADFGAIRDRPRALRVLRPGHLVVDCYGLASFVWALNRSLRRFVPGYSPRAVERAYLHLWQRAAIGYLGAEPQLRTTRAGVATGLAIDEAVAWFLERTDWSRRGAGGSRTLPAGAEALQVGRRATRRAGARHGRVETAWGDLYLDGTLPAFFRSAF